MTTDKVARTWFSDEKVFTVQTPTNTQNDCVYAAVSAKHGDVPPEWLLQGRKHFSPSVMVSVSVSKRGKTSLVFVKPGAKINSTHYCDHVQEGNGLLQDIRRLLGTHFIFQQGEAPADRSR